MKKILLTCPVSSYKDYIIWDWLKYIQKLTYPVDILLVDNSDDLPFLKKIANLWPNIKCVHVFPLKDDVSRRHIMAKSMDIIRLHAISNRYDYLFSLECDVFPPLNIIEQLLAVNNPVVGCLYFIDHGADSKLMLQRIENPQFGNDSVVRLFTQDEGFLFCDGTVKYVFSCGFGCTLICTDVLKNITFRTEDTAGKFVHHDNIFFMDMYRQQIPVKVHTGIICKHFNGSWAKVMQTEHKKLQK